MGQNAQHAMAKTVEVADKKRILNLEITIVFFTLYWACYEVIKGDIFQNLTKELQPIYGTGLVFILLIILFLSFFIFMYHVLKIVLYIGNELSESIQIFVIKNMRGIEIIFFILSAILSLVSLVLLGYSLKDLIGPGVVSILVLSLGKVKELVSGKKVADKRKE